MQPPCKYAHNYNRRERPAGMEQGCDTGMWNGGVTQKYGTGGMVQEQAAVGPKAFAIGGRGS